MTKFYTVLTTCLLSTYSFAQVAVSGEVTDSDTAQPLPNAKVVLNPSDYKATTNLDGSFRIEKVEDGNYSIVITSDRGAVYRQELIVNGKEISLGKIQVKTPATQLTEISLSTEELDSENSAVQGSTTFLQSSKDAYAKVAAYEWGSFFFRPRGLDSRHAKILFNGVEMNKASHGRPDWKNWGGLNDVTRYPETAFGIDPTRQTFGGLAGSTAFNTRASSYRKGTSLSASYTNRSYSQRLMATHSTGMMEDDWAFTVSGSKRWASEGIIQGTLYDAYGFFFAAEKKLNEKHSLNFTVFGTPYRKASNSPNTQEVYDLFGTDYNSYWGWYEGKKRNERIKTNFEPTAQVTHFWDASDKTKVTTTLSLQSGYNGNTRISRYNAPSTSPSYYKYLPSYNLSREIDGSATIFNNNNVNMPVINQQMNWDYMYNWNHAQGSDGQAIGQNAKTGYILVDDRNDDTTVAFNSSISSIVSEKFSIDAGLNAQMLKSENYRKVKDLLGANGVLNVDAFDQIENDLNSVGRVAKEGDVVDYQYDMFRNYANAFAIANFEGRKTDFFLGANLTYSQFFREGRMWNENYKTTSFGESEKQNFVDYGLKAGVAYKLDGFNTFKLNAAIGTNAPNSKEIFPNQRYDNTVTPEIKSSSYQTADLNYYHKGEFIKAKLSTYYTKMEDLTNINYFFTQNDSFTAFVTEATTGIETQNIGAELGLELKISPSLSALVGANYGQYTYANNPNVYLLGDDIDDVFGVAQGQVVYNAGKAALENYKLGAGPQQAYSFGLQYQTSNRWRFGATGNYMAANYINISNIKRTGLFTTDVQTGAIYEGYNEEDARKLLAQEEFDGQFVLNMNVGKTWRIDKYFVGLFVNANNVLNNKDIKTGGFEQSRTATYQSLSEDNANGNPLFGNKYWYNQGMNFFANLFVRF